MHILFLTDNFPPEGNAPASRTYEHTVKWVEAGHSVTVITCAPNFPEGKLYPGYKNSFYKKSDINGINVIRVKTYITANEGFIKRTLDYISFMFSSFFAGLFQKNIDVVVATSPQFFCACSGWALSAIKRKPFVFELRDIWPASIAAVGVIKDGTVIRLLEKIEVFLYRRASLIVSVTKSFKHDLVSRGIDERKICVVLNGVDLSAFKPSPNKDNYFVKKYSLCGKFVVGYIGTHGMAHGLETIICAAERFIDDPKIIFLFVGGGAAKDTLIRLVEEKKLDNVVFVERQDKSLMPRILSVCDVSVVPLKNAPLFSTVIPSKIFECMGMGIPMIMSVPPGEATTIIESTNTGITVSPESVDALSSAILALKENVTLHTELKNNCVNSAEKYSRKFQAASMLNAIVELLARR